MKRFLRTAAISIAFFLMLAALWITVTGLWLKGSVPRLSGSHTVAGIGSKVRIVRDKDGVPHIFANSREDALFGLGFVHAQDRLWQMDFQRRTVQGRLSEVMGSSTLIADTYLRTLGLYRAAQSSASHLSPQAIKSFEAYAAGVNAAVPKGGRPLPPEFFILGVKPEAWVPADSVAALKGVALQLSSNAFQELLRVQLLRTLPVDMARGLNPPLPPEVLEAYQRYAPKTGSKFAAAAEALHASLPLARSGASNNWVIGGARTLSGKPMLANDPHLALTVPGFWYLAHLHWPGHDAIGGTIPGVPGIIAGKTRSISWGMTTTGADTQDLFWEKIDPDNANAYLTPDGSEPFESRREMIKVRFGSSKPLKILSTRHGPVLPTDEPRLKALVPDGYALALSWPALSGEDHTGETILKILDAQDASPRSVEHIFDTYAAPIQSFVYADTQGNTGLILPGRIPVRGPDNAVKGLLPGDGPNSKFDWRGFLEGADRPHWFGGANDVFVTANNNVVPEGYKPQIALDFDPEHRARRIKSLLAAQSTPFDTEGFKRMQQDDGEQFGMDVLPVMLKLVRAESDESKRAVALLKAWDVHMKPNASEPLIFAAWVRQFTKELIADELGDLFKQMWSDRPEFIAAILSGDADSVRFCDDTATKQAKETCNEVLSRSLDLALDDLKQRFGSDMSAWRWGKAHQASFSHTPFGFVPVLSKLFGLKAEVGGGNSTIQRAAYRYGGSDPYAAVHGSGYRGIYDMGAEERSVFMSSTGQSGNVYSPFYDNLTPRWARGDYLPMKTNQQEIEAEAIGVIELEAKR